MGTPLRVLLIEDSDADAEQLVHELERGGFDPVAERVATAESMRSALGKPWDIVLSEYRLHAFDALEALRVLEQSGRDLPLIVVSANPGEETAVAAMHAGARDWVTKDRLSRLPPAVQRELRAAEGRRGRRHAEEALRESEARYRSLVEHTSDIITIGTTDGTILYQSPSGERILGYQAEQLLGHNWGEFVHPQDLPVLNEAVRRMAEGAPFSMSEVRVRHRNGAWRVLEVLSTLKTSLGGETTVLGAARDITDRKQLEEQLRQSQKMEAIGRLAGGVAHDFNNLLTVIMGYGELLREQTPDPSPLRENVERISEAAARAAELTRQLLAFGRRQVLAPQLLDLNALIARMVSMLRRVIGEHIRLVTRLGRGIGAVRADPGQMEQVILNLAVNARDAMPGGGTLTLRTARIQVGAGAGSTVSPGHYVALTVSDTGHGIDAEARTHLFEPFYTTKETGKGTGLGLSAVFGAVNQSGGTIEVDSAPGRGATFSVYLPRVEEAAPATAAPVRREPVLSGETILLVEDEDGLRHLARRLLEAQGYEVLEAREGREALEWIERRSGPIHLLLTDVVMPGIAGLRLAERAASLRPGMPVLFMSGYAEGTEALPPTAALLAKPFTPDSLTRAVREALAARSRSEAEPPPATVHRP